MKGQISGTGATKFNLKFLIEIILIIVVGAIILLLVVLKAKPDVLGGKLFDYGKSLYDVASVGR